MTAHSLIKALGLAALLLVGAAPARAQSPQALQAAVAQIAQAIAPAEIAPMIQPATSTPPSIGASCSWCSSSFIGICFAHDSESWSQPLDLKWQTQLEGVMNQQFALDRKMSDSAAAARGWIGDLPAFSARFDNAADSVLAVQAEIANAAPSDAQRARATQGLQALLDTVSASATRLEEASRTLASALQEQSGYRNELGATLAASLQAGQQAYTDLENAARPHRCQDGVAQQLAGIRAGVTATQDAARARVAALSAQSTQTEQSIATLLGAVINARSQLENVLRLVQAAGNDQLGGFLAQLHLSAAKQQWRELAAMEAQAMAGARVGLSGQARLRP